MARDEYQSYTAQVFRMKKANKTTKEIANHLLQLEQNSMGLNGNNENCNRIAQIINEMKSDT